MIGTRHPDRQPKRRFPRMTHLPKRSNQFCFFGADGFPFFKNLSDCAGWLMVRSFSTNISLLKEFWTERKWVLDAEYKSTRMGDGSIFLDFSMRILKIVDNQLYLPIMEDWRSFPKLQPGP